MALRVVCKCACVCVCVCIDRVEFVDNIHVEAQTRGLL